MRPSNVLSRISVTVKRRYKPGRDEIWSRQASSHLVSGGCAVDGEPEESPTSSRVVRGVIGAVGGARL